MAIRPIRLFGDPILLTEAEPVTDFDHPLRHPLGGSARLQGRE